MCSVAAILLGTLVANGGPLNQGTKAKHFECKEPFGKTVKGWDQLCGKIPLLQVLLSPVKSEMGTAEPVLGWVRDPRKPLPGLFPAILKHLQQRECGL